MNRKQFIQSAIGSVAAASLAAPLAAATQPKNPLAISMWDFSWLERRWDGAGYEDWDEVLDELLERGYNALRIDAYPHLVAADGHREWTLLPTWNTQVWGSPDINRVRVLPTLIEFLGKCKHRNIKVGLSTWYREDADNVRMRITTPRVMADNWIVTLEHIDQAGLMDIVLFVDMCNEWPLDVWVPFFKDVPKGSPDWTPGASRTFMDATLGRVRDAYPNMPLLFSFCNERVETYLDHDMSRFDLFEHHIWMAQQNRGEYYNEIGYEYERFDPKGYRTLSLKAEAAYRARSAYWLNLLSKRIETMARVSRELSKPVITTECWSLVDYKDWPLLRWDWIKEINAEGVRAAANTGQWVAIATSNFCGPQFAGMWRDIAWHRKQTSIIRSADTHPSVRGGRLWDRL